MLASRPLPRYRTAEVLGVPRRDQPAGARLRRGVLRAAVRRAGRAPSQTRGSAVVGRRERVRRVPPARLPCAQPSPRLQASLRNPRPPLLRARRWHRPALQPIWAMPPEAVGENFGGKIPLSTTGLLTRKRTVCTAGEGGELIFCIHRLTRKCGGGTKARKV